MFVVIGTWLLLEQTAVVRVSFWEMWPALLVFFGLFLVWQGVSGPRRRLTGDSNALISATALLGGVSRGNNSTAFRGGELTAMMGGCEIDLRHASIDGEAVIDIFALWGGIEIRVPPDWTVVSKRDSDPRRSGRQDAAAAGRLAAPPRAEGVRRDGGRGNQELVA